MDMKGQWAIPILASILILGTLGLSQDAFADPFTLFHTTFVDSFSVLAQEPSPKDVAFSSDGTKMFVLGGLENDVHEYILDTPFDVSTASFVDSFSVADEEVSPFGVAFSSDGTKMFVVGNVGDDVNEYTLSTPFDLTNAAFVDSFFIGGQETEPADVAFSSNGIKMFVIGFDGNDVNEYILDTPFDVSTAFFVDSFSVAAQEDFPRGLAFSSDGFKMFVLGFTGDDVNEYTLATPFDVSTASFVATFSVAAQDTGPLGVAFSSDGTKMFVVGTDGMDINEYTLTTAFTLFHTTFVDSFSVAEEESDPQGLAFSSDGTKMFVVGDSRDAVRGYTLATPFDVSTAFFIDSFSVAAQEDFPRGLAFSSDGLKMFVVGLFGDGVNEYTLATPFDVSPASFVATFSVAEEEANLTGFAFSSDGTKMFVVGTSGNGVNEYTLDTPFDVFTATFVDSFSVAAQEASPGGVAFSSDGTKMFVVGTSGGDVNEYTLTTPFDVSTASFVESFSVFAQENSPRDLAFSSDGAKMFVVGNDGDAVHEYTLTTAFTLFHTTFVDSFSVAEEEANPSDVAFSPDGTKMFVVGANGEDINEYILDTPFDVSTAFFVDSFSVADEEASPEGLAFSSDGTKMFVVGNDEQNVDEYTLGTPFDVFTATFVDSFSVSVQENSPRDLAFSSDGTKMFVVGISGGDVNEYTLATPFDLTNASFVDSFSVAAQETSLTGLAFSSDGAKMFVVGFDGDAVHEYTLSTPFDVFTATFVDSFSVAAQDTIPQGLAFSSDGTKMFVVGDIGDDINEYNITSISPPSAVTDLTASSGDVQVILSWTAPIAGAAITDYIVEFKESASPTFTVFNDGVSASTGATVTGLTNGVSHDFQVKAVNSFGTGSASNLATTTPVLCTPPPSGNWVVDTSCTMTSGATINNGDLIVRNNSVLTVPFTLNIDFLLHNITVESGSGVLIKSGGKIT